MKTKMLVLGAFVAGILSAIFGGKAFATAGNTAEISSGTWEICVNATLDSQSPDFSLDITKSGFKSQLVLGGGECKTVKLTGSSAYTVSLGSTMGASSVNYEVSEGNLTFNVANSLNNYLNAFGSVTYTTEGSGEESDFELLFSMPGTCYLNGNANVSGDTCKDSDGNPLTDKKYIDTGVALFSEGNAARDFEIYFTLTDYLATQPNSQATLFNAKYEDSSMNYPGFTLRTVGTNGGSLELTGRIGNDNTDADKAKLYFSGASIKGKEVKIMRVGGLVSYSIDGGELIEFQNYKNFSRYFEQNAVFGASLQTNGTPQRYYDGTVSNIRIYLKKLEEETTGNIVFDANGGTGTMAKIEDIELGTDVTLPANTFTKKNANFTGWNTAANGSGTAYADEGTVTISEVGKLTLYAQWEDIPVGSIEFNANGGSGTMAVIKDIALGTNVTLPANVFTMTDATFGGWNTREDGTGIDYADGATITISSTDRITLYAQWDGLTITLVQGVIFNQKLKILADGREVDYDTYGESIKNILFVDTLPNTVDETTPMVNVADSGSIPVYAYWVASDETIYINANNKRLYAHTNSDNMFSNFKSLTSLTLPECFDASRVTSMNFMFSDMSSLISLSLSNNFNTSNVTKMSRMFTWTTSLTSLTLPESFNTSKVTDMTWMFHYMSSLASLTLPESFDTSNVAGMTHMFAYMPSLTSLVLPDSFDTSKVTDMSSMFYNMSSLTTLTLPEKFSTSGILYANRITDMFNGMTSLTSLTLPESFVIPSGVTSSYRVFSNISNTAILYATDTKARSLWPGVLGN